MKDDFSLLFHREQVTAGQGGQTTEEVPQKYIVEHSHALKPLRFRGIEVQT